MLGKRLARGKLTVVDATNVRAEDRKRLVEPVPDNIAGHWHDSETRGNTLAPVGYNAHEGGGTAPSRTPR